MSSNTGDAGEVSQLQRELLMKRPFRSAPQELLLSVLKTAEVLQRAMVLAVDFKSITPQQFNVLRIIKGAGRKGIATLAIAERMVQQTPGLTRLLDRLERNGLVTRRHHAEDRRQVICSLTDSGVALLGELNPAVHRAERQIAAGLTSGELKAVIQVLDKLRRANSESLVD